MAAEVMSSNKRTWLIPVEDADICEKTLKWVLQTLYQPGDTLYFLHVAPLPVTQHVGDPTVAFYPVFDPAVKELQVKEAEGFITRRFSKLCQGSNADYKLDVVHSWTDRDSVGAVVCKKAQDLNAAGVAMAKHNRSFINEVLLGSVTKYCIHHCMQPVLVMH